MDDDLTIQNTGAEASLTYPIEAGKLKKGDYVMIKERPCKIVDISFSKVGKHGHAKANIVGLDIFTGKKYEECCPSGNTLEAPRVSRQDYMVVDVNEGIVTVLDEKGNELTFPLPEGDLGAMLKKRFDNGDDLAVTVLSAVGTEAIVQVKEDKT